MTRFPLGTVALVLVMVTIFGFIVTYLGAGNSYAGGKDDTFEPFEEEEDSQEIKPKALFFILGFLVAVFLLSV